VACPICDGKGLSTLFALYDDRYGYNQDVRLMACADCGHKFSDALLEENVLARLYTEYYPRATFDPENFSAYREAVGVVDWLNGDCSSAARWVPPWVRVLDIGCGLGENVSFHARRGCDACGVDADKNVEIVAKKYGLNVRVGLFDPANYKSGYFDFVTMDQVIEHVSDPVATLMDVRDVLRPGGHLVMSTPNANGWGARLFGRRWLNWHVPYHQQFISECSMSLLAQKTGFVVERMSTITRSAWLIYQLAHLLTYPAQGVPSIFWAPKKNRLRMDQVVMLKLVMATRLTLVPQLMTRLFDSIGLGDNYLIVLKKIEIGER
jgi:2-polyprenyl-3-methyl-5-hydroxy-6-metoxy-1,4-benzoquinol methylase